MRAVLLVTWVTLAGGCAGYTSFSNHQTARLLRPGDQAFTAAAAVARYEQLGGDPKAASGVAFEAIYRIGLLPRLETGAKLSYLRWDGTTDGENTLVYVDTKVSLLPDELAVVLPIGLGFGADQGNGVHHLQVQPGVIYTGTLSPNVALETSLRLILVSSDRLNELGMLSTALTFGVRLRSGFWRFELHPEIGVLVDDLTQEYTYTYPPGAPARSYYFGQSLTVGISVGVTFLP